LKTVKLPYLCNRLTDFDEIWHGDANSPLAAVRSELRNSNSLTVGEVKRPILHQHTKFRRDPSNHCGDIAMFLISQDGGCRHLVFLKIQNFNG